MSQEAGVFEYLWEGILYRFRSWRAVRFGLVLVQVFLLRAIAPHLSDLFLTTKGTNDTKRAKEPLNTLKIRKKWWGGKLLGG